MIERLYYLLYKEVRITRKNEQPFFGAYMVLCFFQYMNLGSIFGIANYFLKYRIQESASVNGSLVIIGVLLLYNYFSIWVKKEEIVSKYDRLPNKNNKLIVWTYIILSFSICFIVLNYFVEYHPS